MVDTMDGGTLVATDGEQRVGWRVWADLGFVKVTDYFDDHRAHWYPVTQPFDTQQEAQAFADGLNLSTKIEEEDPV